jgi:peroxiredoxin
MRCLSAERPILVGDPIAWFSARSVTGHAFELQVSAGRWIVLCFMGSLEAPGAMGELEALLAQPERFHEERLTAHVILTDVPADTRALAALSDQAFNFLADPDGAIARRCGAQAPRTIVLDPMLRCVANIPFDHPNGHAAMLAAVLAALPEVDGHAGVPLFAPALIVPRVFEFSFCEQLVRFYEEMGGTDSGFLLDQAGRTQTVIDHRLKSRRDLVIAEPGLREAIRERIVRRLLPEIERYFAFRATRMDRYMVSCYAAEHGGHFTRHRDNVNAGARHRKFAASINLNRDYEGCELMFPEFGQRRYVAPYGGAIVFSCGALHQVTPVTRGKRYAFIPFLYGEEEATARLANNALLAEGEAPYTGERDRLFPSIVPGAPGEPEGEPLQSRQAVA